METHPRQSSTPTLTTICSPNSTHPHIAVGRIWRITALVVVSSGTIVVVDRYELNDVPGVRLAPNNTSDVGVLVLAGSSGRIDLPRAERTAETH